MSPPSETAKTTATFQGERRYLTMLFSDVIGSTEIASRLDPEDWLGLVDEYDRIAKNAVRKFGGYLAQFRGDGVLAYFGWPDPLENSSEAAIRAGQMLLQGMKAANAAAVSKGFPALKLRIGVHTGLVAISAAGEIYGDAANVAARIESEADDDSIFISEQVLRNIAVRIRVSNVGERTMKGIAKPLHLYKVNEFDPATVPAYSTRRTLAPQMVNREREMAQLLEAWEQAKQGHGRSVAISGEPGIGKSRLLREFRSRIAHGAHAWMQATGSQFFSSTPLYGVANLIRRSFSGFDQSAAPIKEQQIRAALHSAGIFSPGLLRQIEQFLGAAEQQPNSIAPETSGSQHHSLIDALVDWALASTKKWPVVLVMEDVHWVDPSTLEFISRLENKLSSHALLLVTTERSETASRARAGSCQKLALRPLTALETKRLVQQVARVTSIPSKTVDSIVSRSEGVPLFAEELSISVSNGEADGELGSTLVSLSETLLARLDRVGPAKEFARVAALVGGGVPISVVQHVMELSEPQSEELAKSLADADMIQLRSGGIYAFRHSLLQDAAYESLLKRQRKELHVRTASILEERFAGIASARPELLAHHWERASEWMRAAKAWQNVGEASASRGAFAETESAFRKSLSALENLPAVTGKSELEVRAHEALSLAVQITRGYAAPEALAASGRRSELATAGSSATVDPALLFDKWAAASSAGMHFEAAQAAEDLLALDSNQSSGLTPFALMAKMTTSIRMARLSDAERCFEQGAQWFYTDRFGKKRPGSIPQTFGNAALNAWLIGKFEAADQRMQHGLTTSARNDSPYDIAFANFMAAMLEILKQNDQQAKKHASECLRISDQFGYVQFTGLARIALGRAEMSAHGATLSLAMIDDGLKQMAAANSKVMRPLYLGWRAEVFAHAGEWDQALATLKDALIDNPQEPVFHPMLLGARAAIYASQHSYQRAGEDFAEALWLARSFEAKALELRIHVARMAARGIVSPEEINDAKQLLESLPAQMDTDELTKLRGLLGPL